MEQSEKDYFKSLENDLDKINNQRLLKSAEFQYPLMPQQYSYIHNLRTGKFENVNGVEDVLGYKNEQFTIVLYYDKLHPVDRTLIFETSKQNLDTANNKQFHKPFQTQFSILFRIKDIKDQYIQIFRQSTVLEFSEKVEKTFSICTNVSEFGLSYKNSSVFSYQGKKAYDISLSVDKLREQHWKKLTKREFQILEMIASGLTSTEIAKVLNISTLTVNKHRQNIIQKNEGKHISLLLSEIFKGTL